MNEVEGAELKRAVERMHTCKATLTQSVPVRERHRNVTVWERVVHVFDLQAHLTTNGAYAWSSPIEEAISGGSLPSRYVAGKGALAAII
jgi:hypothetical protein